MFFIKFTYNGEKLQLDSNTRTGLYSEILDWLYKNGYEFKGNLHKAFIKKLLTEEEILDSKYSLNRFHKIDTDKYFYLYRNKDVQNFWIKMLENIGVDKTTIEIKNESIQDSKIKKFGEIDDDDDIELDETEIDTHDSIDKVKIFAKNPFRQSICVLGDPGAGKSTTVRKILRNEGYKFQIWEPSAATTGLLSQYSSSKPGYIPSKVGKLMIAASKDPENLYTFVIEEAHKSSVIEMINDELKHAISLRRFEGDRFVPYEDSTEYLSEYLEEDDGGNLKVPDNFGFIFISSKPKVIANNGDIFDRLDIIVLKNWEEEKIQSVSELLSKVLIPEEKRKLKATRND